MARRTLHEHWIEDNLATRLAQAGHLCLKFISPGFPGVPDRIVLTADGRVLFIECKAPGERLQRTQPAVVKMLRAMGHRVEIVDTFAQVENLCKEFADA